MKKRGFGAVPNEQVVDVHGVHHRCVEPGEPHVAHDHDLELVLAALDFVLSQDLLRSALQQPERVAVVCVLDELLGVVGSPGDDHLDPSFGRIIVVPVGAQLDDLIVQVDADLA